MKPQPKQKVTPKRRKVQQGNLLFTAAFFAVLVFITVFLMPHLLPQTPAVVPEAPDAPTAPETTPTESADEENAVEEARFDEVRSELALDEKRVEFTSEMLTLLEEEYHPDAVEILRKIQGENRYDENTIYNEFGITPHSLKWLCETADNAHIKSTTKHDITLAFTGDVCLADDWYNMQFFYNRDYTTDTAFPGTLRQTMEQADVLLINNEFCFSDRGERLPGKTYTFRAKPENVEILQAIGTDIACLANNHCYDYGPLAFEDTMQTLKEADIPYVGGGKNLEEAMRPQYFVTGGRTVAYVAATRAEKTRMTPGATEDSCGVLLTYDPTLFLKAIQEAEKNADYVIAYVHWGAENETYLEPVVVEQARLYIEAGADAVVGSHAHRLHAVDYYNGKPIFYNLGNFYFNLETEDTALATLTITESGEVRARMIPCVQSLATVYEAPQASANRILNTLRSLSPNVLLDDEGYFVPKA